MSDYPGNPASFPDNIDLIDDSDPPDAAHFNLGPEGLADRTAYLRAHLQSTQSNARSLAGNFPLGLVGWPFTASGTPAWDKANARWMMGKTTDLVQASYDGINWSALGGSLSANVNAIIVRPSDGLTSAIKSSNSTMASLDPATDTWNQFTGPGWDASGLPGGTWFAGGGGLFVVWESRPSASERLYTATDAIHYSSDLAPFPANFAHTGSQKFLIISAQSATRLLLFTTKSNFTSYVQTDDGVTFNTLAMPTLVSGEEVVGATYDAVAGLFIIMLSTASGSRVLSSPTGLAASWTVVSTRSTDPAQGLASISGPDGSVLATIFLTRGALWRGMISIDGGVTWRFANITPFVSAVGFFYAEAGGGGSRFLYADTLSFAASDVIGPLPAISF